TWRGGRSRARWRRSPWHSWTRRRASWGPCRGAPRRCSWSGRTAPRAGPVARASRRSGSWTARPPRRRCRCRPAARSCSTATGWSSGGASRSGTVWTGWRPSSRTGRGSRWTASWPPRATRARRTTRRSSWCGATPEPPGSSADGEERAAGGRARTEHGHVEPCPHVLLTGAGAAPADAGRRALREHEAEAARPRRPAAGAHGRDVGRVVHDVDDELAPVAEQAHARGGQPVAQRVGRELARDEDDAFGRRLERAVLRERFAGEHVVQPLAQRREVREPAQRPRTDL